MTISSPHCLRTLLVALPLYWLVPPAASAQPAPEPITWSQALQQPADWYAAADAVRIADNVLLYQHENGGWDKNIDMAQVLDASDRARILEEKTEGATNFDNDATYTQIRYLAKVHDATEQARFRDAALLGLEFVLEAQYPNGGWPQYYPLRAGYYEHVTFNDGAMIGVMRLLRDVARGEVPFTFVDAVQRERAAAAVDRGLALILATQVEVDGQPTVWCAQYDRIHLQCAQARSYEPPSLSGSESVGIVRFLMEIEDPAPEVINAVQSAAQWFDEVKLTGIAVVNRRDPSLPRGFDREVIPDPDAEPLWARFYEIGTNRPMFVGRDGIVRDSLCQIEHERRVGYAYLGGWARELLKTEYPAWLARCCESP